jgi:hypothetical protein
VLREVPASKHPGGGEAEHIAVHLWADDLHEIPCEGVVMGAVGVEEPKRRVETEGHYGQPGLDGGQEVGQVQEGIDGIGGLPVVGSSHKRGSASPKGTPP